MKEHASVAYDRSAARPAGGAPDTTTGPQPGAAHSPGAQPDAVSFWRQVTLAATPDGAPQPQRIPVPAELRAPLALFEASAAGSLNGGPSVPSAGALHPYEHYTITNGPAGPAVFAVDVSRRVSQLLHQGEQVSRALERGGLALPGPDAFLVLTVVRPWLSMRKYGDRGYLYSQLDAAHLGTHLLCLGDRTHRRAAWLTRAATAPLSELLGLGDKCRFLHSTLLLEGPADVGAGAGDGWTCTDWRPMGGMPQFTDRPERLSWQGVAGYREETTDRPAAVHRDALLPGAGGTAAGAAPTDVATSAELAARRRSAKDFAAGELPAGAVRDALAALATPLTTDLPLSDAFGATLVARRVAGLAPGAYPVRGGTIAAEPAETVTATDDDIVRICMGQEHLRHTCAAVVFHARHQEIFRHGMPGVDEALLRVGSLAHLLCLGTTGAGIAATTIGGFDAGRWHALAGLPEEDEVLYVAMLGTSGTSTVKLDRLQRTYAHDER